MVMNDDILDLIRRRPDISSAYIAGYLRGTYPKLTTAEVTRRLLRMAAQGVVMHQAGSIHGGVQYVWRLAQQ
jgi:hypothetical protein